MHPTTIAHANTSRMQTSIFKWYMARPVVKNGSLKGTFYDEIGLCFRNKDTILGSEVNAIGKASVIAL